MRCLGTLLMVVGIGWTTTLYGQQAMEYRVNQTYPKLVSAVERVMNEPRERPVRVPNLPAIINKSDLVKAETKIDAKARRYSATIEYAKGRLHLDHRISLRWTGTDYAIEAFVDIQWRWNSCLGKRIVARVVSKAESMFLCVEKAKILELSDRIDTVEVEQPDSWILILSDAVDLIMRVKEQWPRR